MNDFCGVVRTNRFCGVQRGTSSSSEEEKLIDDVLVIDNVTDFDTLQETT